MHVEFRCATNRWMGQPQCETGAIGLSEGFGSLRSLLWLNWRDCGVKAWMELLCRLRPGPSTGSHTGIHTTTLLGTTGQGGVRAERHGQKARWKRRRAEEQRGKGSWENREGGREGAGEGGVRTAILVGVNICCSACQGSIYWDGLTPGPLVEYWWGRGHRGAGRDGVCVC